MVGVGGVKDSVCEKESRSPKDRSEVIHLSARSKPHLYSHTARVAVAAAVSRAAWPPFLHAETQKPRGSLLITRLSPFTP